MESLYVNTQSLINICHLKFLWYWKLALTQLGLHEFQCFVFSQIKLLKLRHINLHLNCLFHDVMVTCLYSVDGSVLGHGFRALGLSCKPLHRVRCNGLHCISSSFELFRSGTLGRRLFYQFAMITHQVGWSDRRRRPSIAQGQSSSQLCGTRPRSRRWSTIHR